MKQFSSFKKKAALLPKIIMLLLPFLLLTGHSAWSQCSFASAFGSATINTSGAVVTISTCSFAGEYSTISGATSSMTLRFTSSVAGDWITVRSGTPGGAVLAFGQTPLVFANTFTGTVYAHWSSNNTCGTQSTCRTTTVQCTVCAPPPPAPCTNGSSFGSATIDPAGAPVTISTCSFAGEYSTINGAAAGQTLRFTSSVATDFITIHSGTPAGPVLAFGTTPLSFSNTFTGTVYAHWNTPGCGSQATCRTTTVQNLVCLPVTITPPAPTICAGSVQLLTATHSNPPSEPANAITNSGAVNVPILDNNTVSSTMAVSNVPAGAPVNGVSVTLNITHTWDSDLIISLKSPNNQVINLINARGGSGDNFTNTVISSASSVSLATGAAPFTGTFMADGNAVNPPVGFTQTTATFPPLYTTPNGNWSLGIRDNVGGDVGTLLNWSVNISYLAQAQPVWAPLTELFTDPAATIPYTGTPSATVYARPTVNRTYTATLSTTACTPIPASVTITTNPSPAAPTITPNPATVCPTAIRRLDATSGASPVAVIWAPVTELYTDPAATVAYTGTAVSTIYVKPTAARTYTAVIPSSPCPSLPATIPVSFNPNPTVVIVADPGSVLCEGDPALLTVRLGTSSPIGTLYNQTGAQVNGSPSQVFEPANTPFNSQSADDFTVPAGTSWTITRVTADGIGAGNPTSVNVFFYNNSGSNLPGTAVATFNNVTTYVRTGGNYNVTLPSSVVLGAGTYWVSVQVNMSFATGGQWFWGNFGTTNIGNQYAWQNPGGGFGTPCTNWGYGATGCNVGGGVARNNIFSIVGSSLADGGPLPGGYTFLWSPAAGLSSTTTNPVAASPMTTTTYTVTATTGLGCTNQASILMTVNLRPKVTTQPASRTNCAGTSATFTVVGTGTALTYQWQLSTAGPGGPWTNLTNAAPYSGVTTATLTVNPVTVAMSGYVYRCVLSGTCAPVGTANISNGAVLTVNPLPVVTVTPTSGCGGVAGINGLLLTASGADSYTWAPLAGLFTNATTTIPYTGGNTATVYAAPSAFTVYTVTGSLTTTGCSNTATAFINYTPAAPTVTPSSVAMCLGDAAVRLTSSSSTSTTVNFASGPLSVIIPDNNLGGATSPPITVSGIPAAASIASARVTFNITHTWDGDIAVALKAPNNNILNLDYYLSSTGGTGATTGFVNTVISSTGTAALSSGSNPYTGTFRADAAPGTANPPSGPAGFLPTGTTWTQLYSTPNGPWTLGMVDAFGGDQGTLTSWSISLTYVLGVPSTPATWSPIAGLFTDPAATIAYTGTPTDTVYTRPTPSGVYPYQVTVQSLPPAPASFTNPAAIVINDASTGTPYPANLTVSGMPTSGVSVASVLLNGISHTWSDDVDILLQSPTGVNVVLMSDVGGATGMNNNTYTFSDAGNAMTGAANPSGTYRPTNLVGTLGVEPDNWPAPGPGSFAQPAPALSLFNGNVNGVWKLFVVDDAGGDQGSISGGYTINFNINAAACTSPARIVVVTVNQPTTVTTQPVSQTICTDKVATFSAVAGGTGPFSYQWQISTNNGNTWTNIANGGIYSGATSATLTVTAPPVSMSGSQYRVVITGAAPCAPATSFQALLTVNPLPIVVISASPYTSLFPGLSTTLSSTVSPFAAQTYTWLRDGIAVSGATGATLVRDVDGLGVYQLRVTDVNGCTSTSNSITLKDSASGRCFIYPNPNSGQFQVRYYSVANNVLPRSITVYDTKGDRVLTQFYTVGRPYDRMDVDMRKYGKGLYWVEIGDMNGNRITMCRIVIQ